jgi:aspartate 1-decarboxylase
MQVELLKSKIHRAEVTGAHLNYEGSLTIASDLTDKAGLYPYEKILCGTKNGSRKSLSWVKTTPFSMNAAVEPHLTQVGPVF